MSRAIRTKNTKRLITKRILRRVVPQLKAIWREKILRKPNELFGPIGVLSWRSFFETQELFGELYHPDHWTSGD